MVQWIKVPAAKSNDWSFLQSLDTHGERKHMTATSYPPGVL